MIDQETVVVIGNGESRSFLDLKQYKDVVTLIGCNAIHRDINVDHLVCCDKRMVHEVLTRKKSHRINYIYTRDKYYQDYYKLQGNKRVNRLPDLPYQGTYKYDEPEHWGSGPYAVLLAATLNFKTVCLVGFDLYSKNYLVNNVYKNTVNYLNDNANAVDPAFWIVQLRKVFLHYPDTTFKIFNHPNWAAPTEWNLPNVEVLILNELASTINSMYNNKIED